MSQNPLTPDEKAAHQFLCELRTRISTQRLPYQHGLELSALESLHKVFEHAREAMKDNPGCRDFAKDVTGLLNEELRPFTAKWHRASEAGHLLTRDGGDQFRGELRNLQRKLKKSADDLAIRFCGGALGDGNLDGVWGKVDDSEEWREIFADVSFGIPKEGGGITSVVAESFNKSETKEIAARRWKIANPGQSEPAQNADSTLHPVLNAKGLAFSGGGIRSGTFCLGVSQVLAEKGLLKDFDLLSTVSGGGYYGSFLTRTLGDLGQNEKRISKDIAVPDGPDSEPIRHLRQRASFLSARSFFDLWGMATATIVGMLMNWIVPLAVFIAAALLVANISSINRTIPTLFPILAYLPLFLTALTAIGYSSSLNYGQTRSKFWGISLSISTALLLLQGLHHLNERFYKSLFPGAPAPTVGNTWTWEEFLFNLIGWDILPSWESLGITSGALITAVPVIISFFPVLRSPKVISILSRIGLILAALIVPALAVLTVLVLRAFAAIETIAWLHSFEALPFVPNFFPTWPDGTVLLVALLIILTAISVIILNINHTAIHRLYRNRLSKTFVETIDDEDHHFPLAEINKSGLAPYHLINATVNLPTSRDNRLRDRHSDFFLFSKHFTGSPIVGYRDTKEWQMNGKPADLATAMAISGGAFSAHMGLYSLPMVRALLTVLNIRLGFWIRRANSGKFCRLPEGKGPGFFCLLREMLGVKMSENEHWINLSDGGHIENLATYELLRRRSKYIVCVDGEADPEFSFQGFMTLVRHAQIDFGIRIEPDVDDFRLNPETRLSRSHYHLCRITYPATSDQPKSTGLFLYLKLSVTGNESELIKRYRLCNPTFPHQTTLDQFFNEEQFEAYRQLGVHAARGLFADCLIDGPKPQNIEEWFKALAKNLLEPTRSSEPESTTPA